MKLLCIKDGRSTRERCHGSSERAILEKEVRGSPVEIRDTVQEHVHRDDAPIPSSILIDSVPVDLEFPTLIVFAESEQPIRGYDMIIRRDEMSNLLEKGSR